MPKGHIDPEEMALEAAIREIEEESGLEELKVIKYLGSYQRYKIALDDGDEKSEFKTIHMYLFTTNQTQLHPKDKDNPEARWVEPDRVEELLTHRKDKEFYRSVRREISVV